MGLAIWLCTVLAEQLDKSRLGRAINLGAAVAVISVAIVIVLLLLNAMIFTALGI